MLQHNCKVPACEASTYLFYLRSFAFGKENEPILQFLGEISQEVPNGRLPSCRQYEDMVLNAAANQKISF